MGEELNLTGRETPVDPPRHYSDRPCCATKTDGTPCRGKALEDSQYCYFHDPRYREEIRAARSRGGKAGVQWRKRPPASAPGAPDVRLDSVEELRTILASTLSKLLRGEIDVKTNNAIAYSLGVAKNIVAELDLDKRLRELEGRDR